METVTRGALGKSGLVGLSALILSSCGASTTRPVAAVPAPVAVEQARQNQPVGSRVAHIDGDMCKAGEMQWLVGKTRRDIPVPVDVVNRRVVCTTCPVTEDYSPYRLNIFYDANSSVIERVSCG